MTPSKSKITFPRLPPPLLKALLVLGCFEIYLLTLNPAFPNDDSAETVTVGASLGLQHPPGYALAALWGRLWSLCPIGGPCFRVNLGSALGACITLWLLASILFFLLNLLFQNKSSSQGLLVFCALWAPLLLAFSPAFWRNALGAKGGIYLIGLVLQLMLVACLLKITEDQASRKTPWFLLSFLLLGLGFSNHWETQMVFLPAFIFFLFQWAKKNPIGREKLLWIKGFSFLVLAVSPLLYLPLRAQAHPVLDLGSPNNFSRFMADMTRSYVSFREIGLWNVLVQVFRGNSSSDQLFHLGADILRIQGRPMTDHLLNGLGILPLALAGLGLVVWIISQERKLLWFVLISFGTLIAALLSALRIPEGPNASWMLDNFLMPGDWILFLLAGVGALFLLDRLSRSPSRSGPLVLLVLAAVPFLMAYKGFDKTSQEKQTLAYDYGTDLLKSTPRNAVLFAEADEDYFSLYYLQDIEKRRPDIRMIPAFTLFETWGVDQVERLHPELGLTASSVLFPDPIARIIYASSEIVVKSRGIRPCFFSYFNGAFHQFYIARNPSLVFQKSGAILELADSRLPSTSVLALGGLRLRHIQDGPDNDHPSLGGIRNIYRTLGLFPR